MLLAQTMFSQALRGFVYDEFNQPIPYANIYFKFQGNGTLSDVGGKYFYQFTDPGVIELVITAVGYNNKSIKIIINSRIQPSTFKDNLIVTNFEPKVFAKHTLNYLNNYEDLFDKIKIKSFVFKTIPRY